jgi:hypothetical protein
MKQSQRTPALFGLFAASLIACSGGGGTTTPTVTSSTLTFKIGARANGNSAITVFISKADGSLIDSKIANPGTGNQVFTFSNVPNDATVTGAYQLTKLEYNYTTKKYDPIPVTRLQTYPVTEAADKTFYPSGNNEYVATIQASFTGKPTLTDFSSAEGFYPYFSTRSTFATDGTNFFLNLYDNLYQDDLQTDGKFSPVFFAWNSTNTPIGYVVLKDQSLPSAPTDSGVLKYTIAPGDWKADLQTLKITINNLESDSGYYYTSITGTRLGVSQRLPDSSAVFDSAVKTYTFNPKYPPGIFNEYSYFTGYLARNDTQLGRPSRGCAMRKGGLSSLPTSVTLNATTDFLETPTNLSYSETNRPTLAWNYTAPAGVKRLSAFIYDQVDSTNYNWYFASLPATATQLIVPTLPANISSFDPKGNGLKFRFGVTASEYDPITGSPGGYRFSDASRNFADDVGSASVRSQSKDFQHIEPRSDQPDPYVLKLK